MIDGPPINLQCYKWTTFISLYIGYTLIILNRKSFSFILPEIIQEGKLHIDDLGLIASCQNFGYTFSKLIGGVMSDNLNSRNMFSVGLLLSGFVTCIFTGFETAGLLALLWFLQGVFQGGAWPACAKILKQWYGPEEFGTVWSILGTTLNVAAFVGPILTTVLMNYTSWMICMQLFGVVAIVVSLCCFGLITNSPEEAGLINSSSKKKEEKGHGHARGRGTWQDMLQSPLMAVLCIGYLVVFMTRTAALDWGQLLLIEERGHSQYVGSGFISSLELGGILGSVVAGYMADRLVALSAKENTNETPRMKVVMAFLVLTIFSLHVFIFVITRNTPEIYIFVVAFLLGFGIYGPVALYGVMAIEAAPTHLSGTSNAIAAFTGNIGAVLAGLPLSYVATYFNWKGAFIVLEILLVLTLAIKFASRNIDNKMIPVRNKLK